jgi:hypothetical protein
MTIDELKNSDFVKMKNRETKRHVIYATIVVLLIICAVVYFISSLPKHIEPIRTEVVNFDMQTAKQMIEKGDKLISDIEVKDKISRQEYNQFVKKYNNVYDGKGDVPWGNTLFNYKDVEDSKITTLHLSEDNFFPTIYHQGVEIVSAKVTNTYYSNEYKYFDGSSLTIREAYVGSDVKLKGWYLDYIYDKNDKGKWVFYSNSGSMNFSGDGFKHDYLKLK